MSTPQPSILYEEPLLMLHLGSICHVGEEEGKAEEEDDHEEKDDTMDEGGKHKEDVGLTRHMQ